MKKGNAEASDTWQEGVGIEEDNIEKATGKEKVDAGKTEDRKGKNIFFRPKILILIEKLARVLYNIKFFTCQLNV